MTPRDLRKHLKPTLILLMLSFIGAWACERPRNEKDGTAINGDTDEGTLPVGGAAGANLSNIAGQEGMEQAFKDTLEGGTSGDNSGPAAGASGPQDQTEAGTGGLPPAVGGAGPTTGGASSAGSAGVPSLAGSGGENETVGPPEQEDQRPWFSFFTTSQAGLLTFTEDKVNGLGGDLGGLEGADHICATLAQRANPGDNKTWRAFLSAAAAGPGGTPVHAIERIGSGPWYDYNQRLFANNLDDIMPGSGNGGGRPQGADPQLAEMFTDENGDVISEDITKIDNHDMLTGSNNRGRLPDGATRETTCMDWTSTDENLPRPWIGHAWPRDGRSGRHWIADHAAGGCGRGINIVHHYNKPPGQKDAGNRRAVGTLGGYGGFYCFAVTN